MLRGAAEHQSSDRAVAARPDDEQVDLATERRELLARDTRDDAPLNALERCRPICGSRFGRSDLLARDGSQ